ncbi:hypothetical protein CEXT_269341 [Caerostris extrusa]|uniref:Uncharacterized protein n=1 Tax=Caerostris extrusa TaxID=172846 RepID=A0AAV4QF98_CAEEX|nr:hypothetical protein CEXT_269341 [Caerostris extrusa]
MQCSQEIFISRYDILERGADLLWSDFRGPHGEALIYPKLLRPCHCRRNGNSANPFMVQGDSTTFLPNATNTATHVACSTGRNHFLME